MKIHKAKNMIWLNQKRDTSCGISVEPEYIDDDWKWVDCKLCLKQRPEGKVKITKT